MEKETIVKAMIEIIVEKTKWHDLKLEYNGCGHAFDNSFWKDVAIDDSNIPNVVATNSKDYKIELRSFWGNPELTIRRLNNHREELLVLCYSDYINNDEIKHNDNYYVDEVRCNSHGNYKKCIEEIYKIIERIESYDEQ